MDIQHAMTALSKLPDALDRNLSGLTETQWRFKPGPDTFSVLESLCHLRDIEIEGYGVRLARSLREENPRLPDLDGARLARERRYNEQDYRTVREAFLQARLNNLAVLETLTEEALRRRAFLETVGEITLGRLLELWIAHDRGHLEELDALLLLIHAGPGRHRPKPSRSLGLR